MATNSKMDPQTVVYSSNKTVKGSESKFLIFMNIKHQNHFNEWKEVDMKDNML